MSANKRHKITKRVTLVGAGVNTLLAISQIIAGVLGHSQALLADGIHTLSDLTSDFIVLFATNQSARPADASHPYGHGRIETLASVFLGFALVAVGLGIGFRGITSLFSTTLHFPNTATLAFAGLAIVSKECLYHYTIRAARKIHSSLLESNAWHHRSDVFSSIVVFAGISAQLSGIPHMDAVAAIVVAVLIMYMGLKLARKAFSELIDTSLDSDLVNRLHLKLEHNDSVEAVHSLRTRSMGGLGYIDAEIKVNSRLSVSEAHYIAYSLEQQVIDEFPEIIDISIHVDPFSESGHDKVINLPSRTEILQQLNRSWGDNSLATQVSQIQLHYLRSQVEVDLVLPIALSTDQNTQQLRRLIDESQKVGCIGKVNIYFS